MDILILLLIITATSYIFHLWENKKQKGNFVDIILVDDISRPQTLRPDTEALTRIYRYHLDLKQRATFRLTSINDRQITTPIEAIIWRNNPSQNKYKELDFRVKQIEAFFDNIKKIVLDHFAATADSPVLAHSEVYRTIASELKIFKTATEKIMIIHSGLFEKSDLFDSDSEADIVLLFSSPKIIAARFKKAVRPANVKGIHLVFVYAAKDKNDEKRFLQMIFVFRLIWGKHANISVQATDNTYEL